LFIQHSIKKQAGTAPASGLNVRSILDEDVKEKYLLGFVESRRCSAIIDHTLYWIALPFRDFTDSLSDDAFREVKE